MYKDTYECFVNDERRLYEFGCITNIPSVPPSCCRLLEPRVFHWLHAPLPVVCVPTALPAHSRSFKYHVGVFLKQTRREYPVMNMTVFMDTRVLTGMLIIQDSSNKQVPILYASSKCGVVGWLGSNPSELGIFPLCISDEGVHSSFVIIWLPSSCGVSDNRWWHYEMVSLDDVWM